MSLKQNLEKLGKQPDFILIITDQQRATQHFPPLWEEENLKNLTFLKKNGFSFDRAFCNTCMCSPSRATLLTGTYPAQHGVSQTLTAGGDYSPAEVQLDNSLPNIANMLQGEGYDVQYRGKWHLSKGQATYTSLTSADVALYGGMGWVAPDAGEDTDPLNFGGGYANHDAKFIEQAVKYLQQVKLRRAKGDMTPYFLVVSLVNPHDVLAYPKTAGTFGYSSADWSGRAIGLPATAGEHLLRSKKPIAQFQTLEKLNAGLSPLPTEDDQLNYLNFYAYLLKKADGELSNITNELYAETDGKRLADTTIVIQTSDHGEMGLAHGGLRQKMFVAYEENMRVPLVISNPVLFDGTTRQNTATLASLVDVLPTVAALANVTTPPAGLRGVNLLPVMEDGKPVQHSILFTFDDTKAGLNNKPSFVNAANRIRCIRTEKWKYSYYFDAMGSYVNQYELYDLVNDPDEAINLAYNPEYQQKREELAKQLHELEAKKLLNDLPHVPGMDSRSSTYTN